MYFITFFRSDKCKISSFPVSKMSITRQTGNPSDAETNYRLIKLNFLTIEKLF